jgi:hypothetical protein
LARASKMKTKKKPLKKIEKEKKEEESRKLEEIKILDDIPLTSLENCTLDEIISILQNHSCDPHVDSNQAGVGSFITNHVI